MGRIFLQSSISNSKPAIEASPLIQEQCPVNELPIRFFARMNSTTPELSLYPEQTVLLDMNKLIEDESWNQFLEREDGPLAIITQQLRNSSSNRNQASVHGRRAFVDAFRQSSSDLVVPSSDEASSERRQHLNRLANANRFQVRIPPSASEDDRRTIVRYVNTFAEYTDRIVRRTTRGNGLQSIDAENVRRAVMTQMEDHNFTFSNNTLPSFVQTIGAQMVIAFIDHARLLNELVPGNDSPLSQTARRLTIYIVHERFVTNLDVSTQPTHPSPAPVMQQAINHSDSSTAYLELRSRLSRLRARMENGEPPTAVPTRRRLIDGATDNQNLLVDVQRTLSRLRNSAIRFNTEARNVRRRTAMNEHEEEEE